MRPLGVDRRRLPGTAGRKALGLRWLSTHGFEIPRTWVIPWTPERPTRDEIVATLADVVVAGHAYAVRSSSNAEDSADRSFAGLFATVLDARGVDEVASAVERVLDSASAPAALGYADRTDSEPVRMGVIVQEMVPADVSGVVFSADPLTGLERIVIEAVRGQGLALMSGEVTPHRWVRRHGRWRLTPDGEDIPLEVAARVADGVESMAKRYRAPVDAEWVWDGEQLVWLQVRPITTGVGTSYFSNRIARDMLPGLITPLVWSVNIPLVCGAWVRLLDDALGSTGLAADDLARRYYGRAYFNMGALGDALDRIGFARDAIEDLAGVDEAPPERPVMRPTLKTLAVTPRMLVFVAGFRNLRAKTGREIAEFEAAAEALRPCVDPSDLSAEETLARIEDVRALTERIARANIVTPLVTAMFARRLKRHLEPRGVAYDSLVFPGPPAETGANAAAELVRLRAAYESLGEATKTAVRTGDVQAARSASDGEAFIADVDGFLERCGHYSVAGTDFARAPWREDPASVLCMIAVQEAPAASEGKTDREALVASGVPSRLVRAYDRVADLHLLRDRVSSLYVLVYGLFRPLYRHLGALLSEEGALVDADDVFFLSAGEIELALAGGLQASETLPLVNARRAEMEAARTLAAPAVVFGDEAPPVATLSEERLRGLASSGGYHVGPVRKIESPAEADTVQLGDVLVVPYSDVSWSPVFSRAGAVVSEGGGFLSHSAIIAREYGIPAVVSCDGAMSRLVEGALVSVDGFAGTVTVVTESAA